MAIKQVNWMTSLISLALLALGFYGLVEGVGGNLSCVYLLVAGLIGYWLLGGNLRTLIRPMRLKEVGMIPLAMIATFAIGAVLAFIGTHLFGFAVSANPASSGSLNLAMAFMMIGFLFGEEMLVVVLLTIFEKFLPKNRTGLIIAALMSSLIFGALHLSTYDWNVWQAVIVIGMIRLPFTYLWYKSNRNLLVNGTAHWAYDVVTLLFVSIAMSLR
ncbi:CPBP family glutamic-type intramembrane protease [Saccharibacillus sacchari]|uniref:CPBP family glutamic-type intramembrane protease n=1 Tax=Saccharibacillus sacchari TaxID=456493 RepID=UPI0004ADB180|nr:CPBP family glutamic-type intramembrane protease [Saccharibacillus sacchari]